MENSELLLRGLGFGRESLPHQYDREQWQYMKSSLAEIFPRKTRDEWTEIFESVDACVTPVLSPREAANHHYNSERNVLFTEGQIQPQPAPRFLKTPTDVAPSAKNRDKVSIGLSRWGLTTSVQAKFRRDGAFGNR
jgi:alpha-methylacyl-CoA racemase